ncbi:hypothetical protein OF83DRAFT_1095654 [Amylostereum chailletii]|nr:hypothetical protein OF83DRAFT_1095654 [Amylostereum chailletii]
MASPAAENPQANPYVIRLDEKYYGLDELEVAFLKQQTGIQDNEELKAHILKIQAEALAVYPYNCIRRFTWTKLKVARLFPYQDCLALAKTRPGAIFLDIGCCFGNDIRKVVADGWPVHNAIASDILLAFWELGHKLFRSTQETFPARFIQGDIFDAAHLDTVAPFTAQSPPTTARPVLSILTSLNPLHGHLSAIHASAFFHLFNEEQQVHVARALAGLLSPEPGSMIFGQHVGRLEKGLRGTETDKRRMFCHSADSWVDLWDGVVFEKGTVIVKATLSEIDPSTEDVTKGLEGLPIEVYHLLEWSVTRK